MDKCPSCGTDSVFVQFGPWVDFAGLPHYGGRVEAFCNSICGQRFWWYPATHRITRRNTGQTYAQYRANRLSTCRRPHFDEIKASVTVGEADPEHIEVGGQSGWRQTALGWVYWLRGSVPEGEWL